MVEKNYCDICNEELNYSYFELHFLYNDDRVELIQLCNYHKKQIDKFIKLIKKSEKKKNG